jgi:hypothetical protein
MTYTELFNAIQSFAVDAEASFLAQIPYFVKATEKRIINDADIPVATSVATLSAVLGTQAITPPSDFLSVDSINILTTDGLQYLLPKSVDFLTTAFPDITAQATPRYYAVSSPTSLALAPVSDGTYTLTLRYLCYPTSIVTAGTSWIGNNYEHALLYGALRDAAVYLKEEADIVAMYNNQYNEALGQIKTFGAARSRVDKYRRR